MYNEILCPGCGEKLSIGVSICPVCATQLYVEQGVMNKGMVYMNNVVPAQQQAEQVMQQPQVQQVPIQPVQAQPVQPSVAPIQVQVQTVQRPAIVGQQPTVEIAKPVSLEQPVQPIEQKVQIESAVPVVEPEPAPADTMVQAVQQAQPVVNTAQ